MTQWLKQFLRATLIPALDHIEKTIATEYDNASGVPQKRPRLETGDPVRGAQHVQGLRLRFIHKQILTTFTIGHGLLGTRRCRTPDFKRSPHRDRAQQPQVDRRVQARSAVVLYARGRRSSGRERYGEQDQWRA